MSAVEQYPVKATVRDTRYNQYGTVVEHRATNPANPADTGVTVVVEFAPPGGGKHLAQFPSPEERLERVHILTHDELVVLDQARHMSAPGDAGLAILDAHLHPTRTQTFTVTVVTPTTAPEATEDAVVALLTHNAPTTTHVTVTEVTA